MKKFILFSLFLTATAAAMTPPGGPNPHDDDLEEQPQKEQKLVDKNDNKDRKSQINLYEITKKGNELELQRALEAKEIDPSIEGYYFDGRFAGCSIFHHEWPLLAAVKHNNQRALELLLAHGAKVDQGDILGSTALHKAAQDAQFECILVLLTNGASVNAQTTLRHGAGQHTPLHYAVHFFDQKKMDCTKLLVLNGGDPLIRAYDHGCSWDFNGTVMDVARRQYRFDIPKIITDAQAQRDLLCKFSSRIFSTESSTALSQLPKELIALIVAYTDNHVVFTLQTMDKMMEDLQS